MIQFIVSVNDEQISLEVTHQLQTLIVNVVEFLLLQLNELYVVQEESKEEKSLEDIINEKRKREGN